VRAVLLLALVGCPKRNLEPVPEVPIYALVRPDTPLRTAPTDAPINPWRSLDATVADAGRGYGWTLWRVASEAEGWTRIQSVPRTDPDAFCVGAFQPLQGLVIDLWVPTASLGTVTTREVTQVYTDGTGWQLSAGLPVVTSANGSAVVRIGGGLSLLLPQAPPDVGTKFPATPPLFAVIGPTVTVPADRIVPLGPDAALGFDALHEPLVMEEKPNPDGLAVAATRCAKIVAPLKSAEGGLVASTGRNGRDGPPLASAAGGSTAYWPSGEVAGRVVIDRPLDVEVADAHGRRCFLVDLVKWRPDGEEPPPDQALTLCFDPGAILEEDV